MSGAFFQAISGTLEELTLAVPDYVTYWQDFVKKHGQPFRLHGFVALRTLSLGDPMTLAVLSSPLPSLTHITFDMESDKLQRAAKARVKPLNQRLGRRPQAEVDFPALHSVFFRDKQWHTGLQAVTEQLHAMLVHMSARGLLQVKKGSPFLRHLFSQVCAILGW